MPVKTGTAQQYTCPASQSWTLVVSCIQINNVACIRTLIASLLCIYPLLILPASSRQRAVSPLGNFSMRLLIAMARPQVPTVYPR